MLKKKPIYLSYKDAMFMLGALEAQIKDYNKKIADDTTDIDEAADMGNDLIVLESLVERIQELTSGEFY